MEERELKTPASKLKYMVEDKIAYLPILSHYYPHEPVGYQPLPLYTIEGLDSASFMPVGIDTQGDQDMVHWMYKTRNDICVLVPKMSRYCVSQLSSTLPENINNLPVYYHNDGLPV